MAKAPVAGLAKTRLAPALGTEGAAQLARRMLGHALAQAWQSGIGPVLLSCAPDRHHPAFAPWADDTRLRCIDQGEGDLGQRMARALHLALGGSPGEAPGPAEYALLIGTDAPALDASYLRQAKAALQSNDAVFGPTADGGYVLVGLRRAAPSLFAGVTWSTPQVMAQTRLRLREAALSHAELATLHDIDEPADLVHLPPGWA